MNKQLTVERLLEGKQRSPTKPAGEGSAPANIALCKYWGKRDSELHLPFNSSLSISLGQLGTQTKLSLCNSTDRAVLNGRELPADSRFMRSVSAYLDLFRGDSNRHFLLETQNTVPTAAGVASSASGFAALTLALNDLFQWNLPRRELSILARLGSGSASRSLYSGFVIWHRGETIDGLDSFSEPLTAEWPELCLGLLLLSAEEKTIASRPGMEQTVKTSPYYQAWVKQAERDLVTLQQAIAERDFATLGATAEQNALGMHASAIAARPPVLYWSSATIAAMEQVWALRKKGVDVYFTADAGPNLKLLFETESSAAVQQEFPTLNVVKPFGAGSRV